MLTELEKVPQHGGRRRRWFRSAKQELIVWFSEDDSMWGFQLCYDLDKQEKALTWTQDQGFSHERVDDGEDVGLRHKRTPILVIDACCAIFWALRLRSRSPSSRSSASGWNSMESSGAATRRMPDPAQRHRPARPCPAY